MKIDERTFQAKNGIEYVIRSATAADAETMLDHLRITHKESYQNLNQSSTYWKTVSLTQEAQIMTLTEASPSRFLLVALHREKIVAGLGVFGEDQEFVRQNARVGMSLQSLHCGQGLGSRLLEVAIEEARPVFHRLELNVRTYNEPGIALYEKMGFRRVGLLKEIAFIDGTYVDEYKYELILA